MSAPGPFGMGFLDRLALAVATLGPAGRSPRAPGTAGSAVALLAAPWVFLPFPGWGRALILLAVWVLGGLAAGRVERLLGRKDPGCVVVDELLGQWIACLPLTAAQGVWGWPMVAALAFFRFFDILKPWPVRAAETWLPDGWGVMLDDAVAGVLAALVLALGLRLLP